MPLLGTFPPADPGIFETLPRGVDFSRGMLSPGEAISTFTVSISVKVGFDPDPNSRLIGSPYLSGNAVLQFFGNLISDVLYRAIITVTTTAGRTMTGEFFLPCNPLP